MPARRLLVPALLAVVVMTFASCGGSSPLSDREACTRVRDATTLAGKKGVASTTSSAQLDDALAAATDVKDPQVRRAAREAQALGKQKPASTVPAGTYDFSRIGAVATLLARCQKYLR